MPQSSLAGETQTRFAVQNYDLGATLTSGQAFRWRRQNDAWIGIIGSRWVQLLPSADSILAVTSEPTSNWRWLVDYLQMEIDLAPILASFPADEPMRAAVQACRGLRLLRQEPWECLASFILSSTKQIVQIQQIIHLLCQRFGDRLEVPAGHEPVYAFPAPQRLAEISEMDLRACKMGFRAPYLKAAARLAASSEINLNSLSARTVQEARTELLKIPGVGRKIADCVLLFAYDFQSAFPVDVWVMKALRELYFRGRRVKLNRLQRFSESHFGPYAGYAQQYLFHYMRFRKQPEP
jgi:N-glycosylase/DNA lyase